MPAETQAHGNRRLRVLMSSFACEPGRGSEQEVGWKWATEMARFADVTVFTQTRNQPAIEREFSRAEYRNLTLRFVYLQFPGFIYRLKSRFDILTLPYFAAWQFLVLKHAHALHREQPFDLAHHVTFVTFRVPVFLKRLRIPFVFGPVGGAETARWGLLSRGVPMSTRAWESFRNIMTGMSARALRLFPPIHRDAGVCLAATPGMRDIFEDRGFPTEVFPAIGVEYLPEPLAKQAPRELARRFLFVGRLVPLKGVHLLLEAFARLPVEDARLTIVGSGQQEGSLRARAEGLGIGERVEWTGNMPRENLSRLYSSHDVLVAPSFYESGGMAVVEAMQHARPAIVLGVGGHALSVGEGCGFQISPDGPVDGVIDGISEAMRTYTGTEGLAGRHGLNAFRRVMEVYSWERKILRMKDIYEKLSDNQPHYVQG